MRANPPSIKKWTLSDFDIYRIYSSIHACKCVNSLEDIFRFYFQIIMERHPIVVWDQYLISSLMPYTRFFSGRELIACKRGWQRLNQASNSNVPLWRKNICKNTIRLNDKYIKVALFFLRRTDGKPFGDIFRKCFDL